MECTIVNENTPWDSENKTEVTKMQVEVEKRRQMRIMIEVFRHFGGAGDVSILHQKHKR